MKFLGIEIGKKRIARALFGWSLWIPSKKDSAKPFDAKITSNEADEESWIEPLDIAEDSILRQTDPIRMTRKERHESTIRYWMECKGLDRKEVKKPLTDERMKEIGRGSWAEYDEFFKTAKPEHGMTGGLVSALKSQIAQRPPD